MPINFNVSLLNKNEIPNLNCESEFKPWYREKSTLRFLFLLCINYPLHSS